MRFRGLVYVLAGQRLCEADGRPSAPASPQKMPVVGFLNGGSAGPFAQYPGAH